MHINNRTVVTGLVIIVIIWAANIFYFKSQQIPKPLVMKHYYEIDLRETTAFDIYYLMNKGDNIQLVGGKLPEGASVRINAFDFSEDTYTHHVLRRARVEIFGDELEELLEDGKYKFTELELYFSNGLKRNIEIGEIIIYQRKDQEVEDNPLQFIGSGSSSDNIAFTFLSAEKPVAIQNLAFQWQEELQGFIDVYINTSQETLAEIDNLIRREETLPNLRRQEEMNEYHDSRKRLHEGLYSMEGEKFSIDLFPITLQAGDYIKINQVFNVDKKDSRSRNYYSIHGRFHGEVLDHEEFLERNFIWYRPHFNNSHIRQIIREKRGK